jgi:hypothetical protein
MSSVRDIESQQYPNPSDSSTVAEPSDTRADAKQDGSVKADDNDVVWVDWKGPGDPENPKKCVMFVLACFAITLNSVLVAGPTEESGGRP